MLDRHICDVVGHTVKDSIYVRVVIRIFYDFVPDQLCNDPVIAGNDVFGPSQQNAGEILIYEKRRCS